MKWKKPILAMALAMSVATPAKAYDVDTHFYLTYMMARWTGINHEVSSQLAAGAQWIDVSLWTSPMFPSLYLGSRMRRLFHFPTQSRKIDGSAAHGIANFNQFGEAEPNHPMASMLIAEGMHRGDLTMVSAGLHVLEDSFGHAGFNFVFGHAEDGHAPDRFFFEPDKYKVMIERLFSAMWAIRELLPQSALDQNMVLERDVRLNMDAKGLAKNFFEMSGITDVINQNFLQHREYVKTAVEFFLNEFRKAGYFYSHVNMSDVHPPESFYDQDQGVLEALQKIFLPLLLKQRIYITQRHGKDLMDPMADAWAAERDENMIINVKNVLADAAPGLPVGMVPVEEVARNISLEAQLNTEAADSFKQIQAGLAAGDVFAGINLITSKIIKTVLLGQIPTPPSPVHKTEFENDGPIRKKEISVRTQAFTDLIEKNFGQDMRYEKIRLRKIKERANNGLDVQPWLETTEVISLSRGAQLSWVKTKAGVVLNLRKYKAPEAWYTLYQYPAVFKQKVREGFFKPLVTEKRVKQMSTPGNWYCGNFLR